MASNIADSASPSVSHAITDENASTIARPCRSCNSRDRLCDGVCDFFVAIDGAVARRFG